MTIVKQHHFNVLDENGIQIDASLHEDDLVMLIMKHTYQGEKPPPGRFKIVREHEDDGQIYVILEVADRIGGYDMPRLQTKLVKFRIEDIDHIRLLARASLASSILFQWIGKGLASNADLRTRIEKAVKELNA